MSISRRSFLQGVGIGCSACALGAFPPGALARNPIAGINGKTTLTPSLCEMCSFRCPIQAQVVNNKTVFIQGNPSAPQQGTRICARGGSGVSLVNDPQRIVKPMKRTGPRGDGEWQVISWQQAYQEIAAKMNAIKAQHGPESVAFSSKSGSLSSHLFHLATAFGSPNTFTHASTCPAGKAIAAKVMMGGDLAMLFTGVWPQRAFLHWRIQLAHCVTAYNRVYQAALSPNLLERPRLDKHLQRLLNDVVKMRGLITPASKETRIQKSIFEAIQTINRNLVCMLELQINAHWATRASHFVMLNAHTLRETQQMTQQTLLTIAHALFEGNPQPVLANTGKLNDIAAELRQLMNEQQGDAVAETPIHGYVWLSMETARQLELLSHLICRALRK